MSASREEGRVGVIAFAPLIRATQPRAAEEGTTVRTIILQGLKALGIDVPEAEVRDKRR